MKRRNGMASFDPETAPALLGIAGKCDGPLPAIGGPTDDGRAKLQLAAPSFHFLVEPSCVTCENDRILCSRCRIFLILAILAVRPPSCRSKLQNRRAFKRRFASQINQRAASICCLPHSVQPASIKSTYFRINNVPLSSSLCFPW